MKYLLKFWDKKEMVVSEEDGEKVKRAKIEKIECVKINKGIYETKAISYIEPIEEKVETKVQNYNLLSEPHKTEEDIKQEKITAKKRSEFLREKKIEFAKRFGWPIPKEDSEKITGIGE